jgi:hypothetical protein
MNQSSTVFALAAVALTIACGHAAPAAHDEQCSDPKVEYRPAQRGPEVDSSGWPSPSIWGRVECSEGRTLVVGENTCALGQECVIDAPCARSYAEHRGVTAKKVAWECGRCRWLDGGAQ